MLRNVILNECMPKEDIRYRISYYNQPNAKMKQFPFANDTGKSLEEKVLQEMLVRQQDLKVVEPFSPRMQYQNNIIRTPWLLLETS